MSDFFETGLGLFVMVVGIIAGAFGVILVDNDRMAEYRQEIEKLELERDTYKQLVLDKFIEE